LVQIWRDLAGRVAVEVDAVTVEVDAVVVEVEAASSV
jgi:hypothetical protein